MNCLSIRNIKGDLEMERVIGTVSRGLRAPIIREGDDLEKIVTDVILGAEKAAEVVIGDRDDVGITE